MKSDPEGVVMLLLADVKGERVNSTIVKIEAEGQEIRKATEWGSCSKFMKKGLNVYNTCGGKS